MNLPKSTESADFCGKLTFLGGIEVGSIGAFKWEKNIFCLGGKWCLLSEETWHFRCGANTLPETNIAPENKPSEKQSSSPTIYF